MLIADDGETADDHCYQAWSGHDHDGDEDNVEKRVVTHLGDLGQACDLDEGNDEGGR